MDLAEGLEIPSPARSSVSSQGLKARSAVTSTQSEALILQLSSSEELDVISIVTGDNEDMPLQTPPLEELVEVDSHCS